MSEMDEETSSAVNEAHKYSHLYNFSGANKAGMDGMDKDKQAQIIHEMSKDSAFFKRAAKLDAEADLKVQSMKKVLAEVKGPLEEKLRNDVIQMSLELERKRNFSRICCVLDMDMFFAAVEIRDQPHLKDLPVAVGGMSMISTANYVARKYGVRAAMPGFIAKKLCPQLVFVGMSFDKYQAVSDQVKDIIGEYDPDYTSHSLDEVYFDLEVAAMHAWRSRHAGCNNSSSGGSSCGDNDTNNNNDDNGDDTARNEDSCTSPNNEHLTDNTINHTNTTHTEETPDIFALRAIAVQLLHEIRTRITAATSGLTCSAGMAHNHFLAKIGADVNKPDGQYELPPTREAVLSFVQALPTRKVGGIGKVTERMLESLLGIKTMAQVGQHLPQLLHVVTPILFQFLLRTSMGIGSHEGEEHRHDATDTAEKKAYLRKSLSCERTFNSKGISDTAELYARLHKICTHVANDMQQEDLWAKSVTLKLKNVEFELITRIATSGVYFQSCECIENLAKGLLDELLPVNIRLMGVSVSKFKQPECVLDPKQRNMLMFLKKGEKGECMEGGSDSRAAGDMCSNVDSGSSELCIGITAGDCSVDHSTEAQSPLCVTQRSVPSPLTTSAVTTMNTTKNAAQSPTAANPNTTTNPTTNTNTTTATTASITSQVHECPVCGEQVQGMLARFNQHLDRCLGIADTITTDTSGSSSGINGASKHVSSVPKKGSVKHGAGGVGDKAKGNAILAALATAASKNTSSSNTMGGNGSSSNTITSGGSSGGSSGAGVMKRASDTVGSTNSKGGKMQRKEALALEITDYFTFK